ncbi:MAG: hypothetical protein C0463_05355 [Idiomarina sp.]|nr:hypothetical protein [Idiomarina sp.]
MYVFAIFAVWGALALCYLLYVQQRQLKRMQSQLAAICQHLHIDPQQQHLNSDIHDAISQGMLSEAARLYQAQYHCSALEARRATRALMQAK